MSWFILSFLYKKEELFYSSSLYLYVKFYFPQSIYCIYFSTISSTLANNDRSSFWWLITSDFAKKNTFLSNKLRNILLHFYYFYITFSWDLLFYNNPVYTVPSLRWNEITLISLNSYILTSSFLVKTIAATAVL